MKMKMLVLAVLASSAPLAANAAVTWQGVRGAISTALLEEAGATPNGALAQLGAAQQISLPMPEVQHLKDAGEGYSRGSPLYSRQARRRARRELEGGGSAVDGEWHLDGWWRMLAENPAMAAFGYALNILLIVAFAYVYKSYRQDAARPGEREMRLEDGWAYGPLDCRELKADWTICCMALFCPAVRWADTIGSDKIWPGVFWEAFLLFLFLQALGPLTFGVSILISLCVGIYFRQKIRRKFMKAISWKTYAQDCLLWCCCPCCAIAQEAREVGKVPLPEASAEKFMYASRTMTSGAN